MAESYPMSKVRGSSLECQAAMPQEWLRGATPRLRSEAAAKKSYPASKVRRGGREEIPRVRGQGRQPGGANPRLRPGAAP